MKIRVVGTGSGKTSLTRFHSSLLIESEQTLSLIDAGDCVSKALISQKIFPNDISDILISHLHADHLGGLPSLITQMKISNREKPLRIFVPQNLKSVLLNVLKAFYIFPENLAFPLEVEEYEFDSEFPLGDELSVLPIRNTHVKKKNATTDYPEKFFVSASFVLNHKGKKTLYTSDLGGGEDIKLFNENYNFVITEFTHLNVSSIFELFKVTNPEKFFLIHIDEDLLAGFQKELSSYAEDIKERIIFTKEGDEIF